MVRIRKIACGFAVLATFCGCEVRSLRIVGKDEGKIRTEEFAGTWVDYEEGRPRDTIVLSGVSARPAVLLFRSCADSDSAVVALTSGQGLKFFNFMDLHPRKEEYSWTVFERNGDTIRIRVPVPGFFAEAVKGGRLRGTVDSNGAVLLADKSENVVSFVRRNRAAAGMLDGRMRLVKLPGGCAAR